MNVIALVQARMGSSRFPNKVMQLVEGEPLIGILLNRLSKSKALSKIILATSTNPNNSALVSYVKSLDYECFQGDEVDVLGRFYAAASYHEADVVVRITGDCPLVDPLIVDQCLDIYMQSNVDYVSNALRPTYPDGLDVEVFSYAALSKANIEAHTPSQREHVTPYIRESGLFLIKSIENDIDYSGLRWTVDEQSDLDVIRNIFRYFSPKKNFGWLDILQLSKVAPELFSANVGIKRNEGFEMGEGQKLWKRAQKVIPGGNMLLSKRSEMFLPDKWPSYYSRAKGCTVWDLNGNPFIDMSIMGIGTNTLGYGHSEVDDEVNKAVALGNMSTLNCPEEVFLAEKLIELHPWADMAKFARSGGEANAIAIRIARAASGRDGVAICGYHGWHDWYLSANLGSKKNLDGHLLPGLQPLGVPRNLQDTTFPFTYNNFAELERLVATRDIGVIMMEVQRNEGPAPGFLLKVRELANKHGIVLIFDECTSGFRETFGGLHKKYGVNPDMAIFGKALGNGYAITATIGTRNVMEVAQSTFISSTFWTERIGYVAALKTLEVMERLGSWRLITKVGENIIVGWKKMAEKHGLKIIISGIPAIASFSFGGQSTLAYKTLITQEMLKKGFLSGNLIFACIDHTEEVLTQYFEKLDAVFSLIAACEKGELNVDDLLDGNICQSGFKRLN